MPIAYTLIRSGRKSVSIEITKEGRVLVRAPRAFPQRELDRLLEERAEKIEALRERQRPYAEATARIDAQEAPLRKRAAETLPPMVEYYSRRMGLFPTGVRITSAKTRFGSCSGKNRLCFSWRLMAYPSAAVEYVVVHELAHIRYKHHGAAFHALVAQILPDHRERRALLRQIPPFVNVEEEIV